MYIYIYMCIYIYKYIYVYICACVCVCVCVFTSIHREGFIYLDQLGYQGTDQRCCVDTTASSLHRYLGMQNLTFQLATLSCSYSRSEHSHHLTNT